MGITASRPPDLPPTIDRKAEAPSFCGRRRRLVLGPFHCAVTTFPELYATPQRTPDLLATSTSRLQGWTGRTAIYSFDVTAPRLQRSWTLRKTLGDFRALHEAITPVYLYATPTFPRETIVHRLREDTRVARLSVARHLRAFLQSCLDLPNSNDCVALREFLELSRSSLDPRLGPRFKEGWLLACNSGVVYTGRMACVQRWKPLWFVCRDSYLAAYTDSRDDDPDEVVLFDCGLDCISGAVAPVADCGPLACVPTTFAPATSAADHHARSLTVTTNQGRLVLMAPSRREAEDWLLALRGRKLANEYCNPAPLGSFAPPRTGCHMRWLVDGRNTYAAVVEAMRSARFEICLTGWWITPDLGLVRGEQRQ